MDTIDGTSDPLAASTTLVDQTPRDRQSLLSVALACAVGLVAVLTFYLVGAVPQWADGYVDVALKDVDGIVLAQVPAGTAVEPTGSLGLTVATSDLPTGAVVSLWLADGLQALLWCTIVVLLGLFARAVAVGRLFARSTLRLLTWFTAAVFAVVVVPLMLRHLGTNWVLGALDWAESDGPNPEDGLLLWVGYLALFFCVCMQIALRTGARLARDQDGLV